MNIYNSKDDNIHDAINEAYSRTKQYDTDCLLRFNGYSLTVRRDSNLQDILDLFLAKVRINYLEADLAELKNNKFLVDLS